MKSIHQYKPYFNALNYQHSHISISKFYISETVFIWYFLQIWSGGEIWRKIQRASKQYQTIFKIKSIIILYTYDFNALNYQHSHISISKFYISPKHMIFFCKYDGGGEILNIKISKQITLYTIEKVMIILTYFNGCCIYGYM